MYHRDDQRRNLTATRRSDRTIWRTVLPIATLFLSALVLAGSPFLTPAAAQEPLSIGIDASVEGNGPLSFGDIDSCVSVSRGDIFDVDIFVRNVEDLLAWEVYIDYDPNVLAVDGREVDMFLGANPGSSVLDVSGRLSSAQGLYRAAAADTSDPPAPDSGSGVLLRLNFRALTPGTSHVDLIVRDVNGDGLADQGPLLRNVDAEALGDTNGDTVFDGPIENAVVAVDTACDGPGTTTSSTESSGGGVSTALIALGAAGGAVALAVVALVGLRLRGRSRARSE